MRVAEVKRGKEFNEMIINREPFFVSEPRTRTVQP